MYLARYDLCARLPRLEQAHVSGAAQRGAGRCPPADALARGRVRRSRRPRALHRPHTCRQIDVLGPRPRMRMARMVTTPMKRVTKPRATAFSIRLSRAAGARAIPRAVLALDCSYTAR